MTVKNWKLAKFRLNFSHLYALCMQNAVELNKMVVDLIEEVVSNTIKSNLTDDNFLKDYQYTEEEAYDASKFINDGGEVGG